MYYSISGTDTMSKKRRVDRLEKHADEQSPAMPFLYLTQDLDDRDLYHGRDGLKVNRADIPDLEKDNQLIIMEYVHDWKGASQNAPIKPPWLRNDDAGSE